jgi:hypothetical protein
MKRLSLLCLAFSFVGLGLPIVSLANQQPTTQDKQDEKKPQLMDIKGTVRSENGKITFVADEGGKSWDVVNPETLKDHVSHHVLVNAHVYPDKGQIHVMSVTVL